MPIAAHPTPTLTRFETVIVTYNSAGEIGDLLADLRSLAPGMRVIVIDNDSRDETARLVRQDFPEVELVVNPQNVGYARAVNQGLRLCVTNYVFLLNPDIRLHDPAFHAKMLACMRADKRIAAVGPLQYILDGQKSRLNFTWSYWAPRAFRLYVTHALERKPRFTMPIRVTFLNAGCLLLRRAAFEQVGRLNEKYFLYGEEPDLMLKFKRFGYVCHLHPGTAVIHYRERSIGQLPLARRLARKQRAILNITDALARGIGNILLDRIAPRRGKPGGSR
jgi:GT2 family glycosyltransferase